MPLTVDDLNNLGCSHASRAQLDGSVELIVVSGGIQA